MDFIKYRERFLKKGCFKVDHLFSSEEVESIIRDLESTQSGTRYLDDKSNLRRIEGIVCNVKSTKLANERILNMLKNVFQPMTLFKDKYNVKPPKGEGFYAHYDGIFIWKDENGVNRNGWYEYSEEFFNVLIALDKCDAENGTLEVVEQNNTNLTFKELLEHTKNNGTPELKPEIENKMKFKKINLEPGDVVVFSHTSPHRSESNNSERYRRILYFTYNKSIDGDHYSQYFLDKKMSNNRSKTSKALSSRKSPI